jgi:hypothetical protein
MGIGLKRVYWSYCLVLWIFLLFGAFSLILFNFVPQCQDWIFDNIVDPYTKLFVFTTTIFWPVQPVLCVVKIIRACKYRTVSKQYIICVITSLMVTLLLWIAVLCMWIEWTGV